MLEIIKNSRYGAIEIKQLKTSLFNDTYKAYFNGYGEAYYFYINMKDGLLNTINNTFEAISINDEEISVTFKMEVINA